MNDDIHISLDKALCVRSKISNYPLNQPLIPIPNGISVVIFENHDDIDQYFNSRDITDRENFEISNIISFYDFMLEVADMGFAGVWFYKKYPIFFSNYLSDIDIELPSFAIVGNDKYIGSAGAIIKPKSSMMWNNFDKTDKILRRFVQFVDNTPFNFKEELFSIVYANKSAYSTLYKGGEKIEVKYTTFPDASPLQGPYVSDIGAYCIFTEKELAENYLNKNVSVDKSPYKVEKLDSLISLMDVISNDFPFIDIGINPGGPRFQQGYFSNEMEEDYLIKTIFGLYKLKKSDCVMEYCEDSDTYFSLKPDTIESPNVFDSSQRGLNSSIKNPLKTVQGRTKSTVPRGEIDSVIQNIFHNSKKTDWGDYGGEPKDISSDSFLIFGFDKISGEAFGNNADLITPFLFQDIIDAIVFFYNLHFQFDYELRFNGYTNCYNLKIRGTKDKKLEDYILNEERLALEDLLKMILEDGYKIEHAEFLKSYVNRTSISLEIENCGYLGDLSVFNMDYLSNYGKNYKGSDTAERVKKLAKRYSSKIKNNVVLDDKVQKKIKILLGSSYNNLSVDSLIILETALKQFNHAEQRVSHDYAGITMKLCKVFERELNIMIFYEWRKIFSKKYSKDYLKTQLEEATSVKDETLHRLISFLQKRQKLELGSMYHVIKQLRKNSKDSILNSLNKYILSLNNHDFILSEEFLEIVKIITSRYRNGGVHEKIVTYEICREAFENIVFSENNYLKQLANI